MTCRIGEDRNVGNCSWPPDRTCLHEYVCYRRPGSGRDAAAYALLGGRGRREGSASLLTPVSGPAAITAVVGYMTHQMAKMAVGRFADIGLQPVQSMLARRANEEPVHRSAAVARMIFPRQTCFCGLFRSTTTRSSRSRSAALTLISIPSRRPAY